MTPKGILETVIHATDLDAAEKFYADVLGFELYAKVEGRHIFYRCGDQMFLIFNPDTTKLPPSPDALLPVPLHGTYGQAHVCFRANALEIDAWRAHLENKGVAIEVDFEWPGGGRSIYFRDPAGNCLEFAEPKIWGLD